jgi:hypothetical protein
MSDDKPMTHKQYVRWALRRRNAQVHTESYGRALKAFGLVVVILVLAGIGAGLIWLVHQ